MNGNIPNFGYIQPAELKKTLEYVKTINPTIDISLVKIPKTIEEGATETMIPTEM
jgi:hypothetical protein